MIPAYRVAHAIVDLLSGFDASVRRIFVVDDGCPEGSGRLVRDCVRDPRVSVIRNTRNLGVGGATAIGFRAAFDAGCDIMVKVDGDGQHRPEWVSRLVAPVVHAGADMAKGNRFAAFGACLRTMPVGRLAANLVLSAVSRPATGYWRICDPACGFLALRRDLVGRLPWARIDKRYFFESDLLFHVGIADGIVVEVPIEPVYPPLPGGVRLRREILPFAVKSMRNMTRRLRQAARGDPG